MRFCLVLGACLALVGACAAPGQQRSVSSPAPAGTAASGAARARPVPDALEWDRGSSEIRCPTGTNLSLPANLAGQVRRIGPDEVQVAIGNGANARALLVKASAKGKPMDQFFADWAELVKLVAPDMPTKTIEAKAHMRSGHLLVDYFAPDQRPEQHYELGYAMVIRNDQTCRFAALQSARPGKPAPVALLDRITDAPGLQLAPPAPKREDGAWVVLRLLLDLGSQIRLP